MANRQRRQPHAPTFSDNSSDEESDTGSRTSSNLTNRVPPLTRASSLSSSEASATLTDEASAIQNGFILRSDDGDLSPAQLQEPDADLLCPFQILDCDLLFSSIRNFKIHVFSHFRGHPLPQTATCFLCTANFHQTADDDQALAWNRMLSHMAHDHFRKEQETGVMRPAFPLMRWMYDRKIIDEEYFKRAQLCPEPVLLPTAIHRRLSQASSRLETLPEAPSPPEPESPSSSSIESSLSRRRSSAYYASRPSVIFASARAERRRRDSMVSSIRYGSVAGSAQ